jgi:hypothetical protein
LKFSIRNDPKLSDSSSEDGGGTTSGLGNLINKVFRTANAKSMPAPTVLNLSSHEEFSSGLLSGTNLKAISESTKKQGRKCNQETRIA